MLTMRMALIGYTNALGVVNKSLELLQQAENTWNQVKLPNVADSYASFKNIVDLYA